MKIDDTTRTPRRTVIALLGISETHFHRLQAAGIFKAKTRGQYDLKECIQAWTQYHADGRSGADMAEEKRLLVIAQRKQIELSMKERTRELVSLAEVQSCFNEAMVIAASQLDGLRGRGAGDLAGLTDPVLVGAWLFDETRRIRDATAQRLEAFTSDLTGRGAP